jgi:hypothetical protein
VNHTGVGRVSLPSGLFDERSDRLALWLWGLVFVAFGALSVARPGVREVLHVYRDASNAWLAGEPVYPRIDYPLPFVVLFVPFARLPVPAAEILWRLLEMAIYVSALHRLAAAIPAGPKRLFFFLSILALPAALGSIKSGQTNLLLAGAMAHATVDWIRGRRRAAAGWLLVSVVAKPIAIVMGLLLAVADLAVGIWLAAGLLLAAALPLLFDPWTQVVRQYSAWSADILGIAASPEHRFDDLNGLLRALHVYLPPHWLWLIRIAAALLVLFLWLRASKRLEPLRSGLMLLGLSTAYLMLFNPRTESNSYVMLSHVIAAFAALLLVVERRRLGWLLVGLDAATLNGSFGPWVWSLTKLWLMPALAVGFLTFLVYEVIRSQPSGALTYRSSKSPYMEPSRSP